MNAPTPEVKAFLYAWLGKQRRMPNYVVNSVPCKKGTLFRCQLRVAGYDHTSYGNASNKKDAQTNAATNFCAYLIERGFMNPMDAPFLNIFPPNRLPLGNMTSFATNNKPVGTNKPTWSNSNKPQPSPSFFNPHAAATAAAAEAQMAPPLVSAKIEAPPVPAVVQVEVPPVPAPSIKQAPIEKPIAVVNEDMSAKVHGSWTLENAKDRLDQFLLMNKISASFTFTGLGANKGYLAEMTFSVPKLNQELYAREHGDTKVLASKASALTLVRQLFHHGLIEKFNGVNENKKPQKTTPFTVKLSDSCVEQLKAVCQAFDLEPTLTLEKLKNKTSRDQISLDPGIEDYRFKVGQPLPVTPITWSPPAPSWNPWLGSPITDGKFAKLSMTKVNTILSEEYLALTQDPAYVAKRSSVDHLPVMRFKKSVLDELGRSQVVLIRGDTGCGKTTQVPQIILDSYLAAGKGSECSIVVTQPRRLSAVTLAERVSGERCETLGTSCGFSVRFESQLPRPYGSILYCTVGVLLRRLESGLRGVSHIVVDEIHERDLPTDLLLVLLKDMAQANKNLRIVLMSATIETNLFSRYFDNCPVIQIAGQAHTVQEYYLEDVVEMLDFVPTMRSSRHTPRKRKLKELDAADDNSTSTEDEDEDDEGVIGSDSEVESELNCNAIVSDQYPERTRNAMKSLSEKHVSFELIAALMSFITDNQKQSGSILIFLPGCNLINGLVKHLVRNTKFGNAKSYTILPLHSQLPRDEQFKVFAPAPEGKCKIIVSTNIAESSVTIDDIVYVIDSCRVKQKIFNTRNNLTSHATVYASKSSCAQRKGRAGRVRPGHYFCLVSKARYELLDEHAVPEIMRAPLLELELSIKLLKLGDLKQYLSRAVQAPPLHLVAEAEAALKAMNALDSTGELTPLGAILARLPLEPRIGKVVVLGCLLNVGDSICTIAAAATSTPELFVRDHGLRSNDLSAAKKWSNSRSSDHVATLKAFWQWLEFKQTTPSAQGEREFCEKKSLNLNALRMIDEARLELKSILIASGFPDECFCENSQSSSPDPGWQKGILDVIATLLCHALYPNTGFYLHKRRLLTANGSQVLMSPSSVNFPQLSKRHSSSKGQEAGFKSPFFVFAQKLKTNIVSARHLTMVTPLQVLLFASQKVETASEDLICLDDWIHLKMDHELAAYLLALKPAIEKMLVIYLSEPALTKKNGENIQLLVDLIYKLSDQDGFDVAFSKCEPPVPPAKEPTPENILPFWVNKTPVSVSDPVFKTPHLPPPPNPNPNKKMALSTSQEPPFRFAKVEPRASDAQKAAPFHSASRPPQQQQTLRYFQPRPEAKQPIVNTPVAFTTAPPSFNKFNPPNKNKNKKHFNQNNNRSRPRR